MGAVSPPPVGTRQDSGGGLEGEAPETSIIFCSKVPKTVLKLVWFSVEICHNTFFTIFLFDTLHFYDSVKLLVTVHVVSAPNAKVQINSRT